MEPGQWRELSEPRSCTRSQRSSSLELFGASLISPSPPIPAEKLTYREGDVVKIDHEAQSGELVVKDNHTPDTTVSNISSKSLPLKSDEDDFEDGFFYSSRR
jgi:hypothetical protein